MYNIYSDIENEIMDAINPILDQYLQGRTVGTKHARNVMSRNDYDSYFDGIKKTIFNAKKDFNNNKNLSQLLKDIKYIGQRNFMQLEGGDTPENELKYRDFVRKILKDIIKDRIALEKDRKVMENVKSFEDFNEPKYTDAEYFNLFNMTNSDFNTKRLLIDKLSKINKEKLNIILDIIELQNIVDKKDKKVTRAKYTNLIYLNTKSIGELEMIKSKWEKLT